MAEHGAWQRAERGTERGAWHRAEHFGHPGCAQAEFNIQRGLFSDRLIHLMRKGQKGELANEC